MSRLQRSVPLLTFVATAHAAADVLWDQPHDYVRAVSSEEGTFIPSSRIADDFSVNAKAWSVHSVTGWLVVTFPDSPADYAFSLYMDNSSGGPADSPFLTITGPTMVDDLGEWNLTGGHLFEVRFELEEALLIDAGTYWISHWGIGNGTHEDRAFWGTAGFDGHQGSEAYFRSEHFGYPNWTSVLEVYGEPDDFAFRIEGEIIPAPAALLAFVTANALRGRRRR